MAETGSPALARPLRVGAYHSEQSIWADTVAKRPGNARAWSSLANVLVRENRWAQAGERYARAVDLRPDYADTQNDYANVLLHLGQAGAALAHYREAHRLKPEDDDIQLNYADALAQTRALEQAIENERAVITRDPTNFRALNSLGEACLRLSRPADALASFMAASHSSPIPPSPITMPPSP